ncbi:MAG: GNAT family N-acetyltransferase [Bacteroidota bacterium]|nr:GNAT family N-acetyltransferase [Bacteroidota bacterium]
MKQEIIIRRALIADASLLSELSSVTFFDTFKDTCTAKDMQGFIADYFSLQQVEKELQDESDFYFIAFIGQTAVGYLRIKEEESDVEIINKYRSIELKRIYVLKEYLSQKVGASLMKFALEFAEENNYELLWLGVWEHNERAKLFYNKFGFIDTGVLHPFPIGSTPQTDVWMYKLLKTA